MYGWGREWDDALFYFKPMQIFKYGVMCSVLLNPTSLMQHWTSYSSFCDVIHVGDLQIANVYKPPSLNWEKPALPSLTHPAVHISDFNIHDSDWGYTDPNQDGEELVE